MKKLSLILSFILAICLLCSCSDSEKADNGGDGGNKESLVGAFETVINANEYILYQNVFYNDMASDYVGKEQTKIGTFAKVYDRYNDVTRYYVWGYYDQTKCCDWQWEICPDGLSEIPAEGSKVTVKGTFTASDKALDKYWLSGTTVSVDSEYAGKLYDVNMCFMSATLERVQLVNMQNYPDFFEGKTVSAYGRVFSLTHIQHPYYDSTWTQEFETDVTVPAIGTPVTAVGTYKSGVIADCVLEQTSAY
ncbi:MAG: hypothetical protein PUC29_02890 [Clostridia bacterium]|nr:hypothetical protein [Clostridia bacterium]